METNVHVQSPAVEEKECRAAPMYCCDNERKEAAGQIWTVCGNTKVPEHHCPVR
jgi:hypothetical protein